MEFMFIGNPLDSKDNKGEVTAYGVRFPLNIAVKVDNPAAIKKLMGNNHFVIVDGGKPLHPVKKLIVPEDPALIIPTAAKPKRRKVAAGAEA